MRLAFVQHLILVHDKAPSFRTNQTYIERYRKLGEGIFMLVNR